MLEELTSLLNPPLGLSETIVRLACALVAAIIAYVMYQIFYGSRHIGAGVHRTFLIGGPAIALIFLVIQTSIPLGIGLLGALSFVRFRTPIKDPAEIGFLLLLIASAIGTATGNILPTFILFAVVFATLGIHRLITNKVSFAGRGHLMLSIEKASFPEIETSVSNYLKEQLNGLSLDTMSTMDDRISLQYQYRRRTDFDWTAFSVGLDRIAGETRIDLYVS